MLQILMLQEFPHRLTSKMKIKNNIHAGKNISQTQTNCEIILIQLLQGESLKF